jgi:hypothetical protein
VRCPFGTSSDAPKPRASRSTDAFGFTPLRRSLRTQVSPMPPNPASSTR